MIQAPYEIQEIGGKVQEGEMWIGDTVAAAHMTYGWEGFKEAVSSRSKAQFLRQGDTGKVQLEGTWRRINYKLTGDQRRAVKKDELVKKDMLFSVI